MKTQTVKPILIDSKESTSIGSIMKCINHAFSYIKGLDTEIGKLALNTNPYVTKSNEYWQHKELILISLDDEIKDGDLGLVESNIKNIFGIVKIEISKGMKLYSIDNQLIPLGRIPSKVIARQSQISPEYIQQFIEEYNNDKVKDIEIEMEEAINAWVGEEIQLQPKLTNGFITIIERVAIVKNSLYNGWGNLSQEDIGIILPKKEHVPIPILYTESEVFDLILEFNNDKEGVFDATNWFNQNKKK